MPECHASFVKISTKPSLLLSELGGQHGPNYPPQASNDAIPMESQTGLQDLYNDETQSAQQAQETASCPGQGSIASTHCTECDLESGLYARLIGKW